jgi:hypothetical protein
VAGAFAWFGFSLFLATFDLVIVRVRGESLVRHGLVSVDFGLPSSGFSPQILILGSEMHLKGFILWASHLFRLAPFCFICPRLGLYVCTAAGSLALAPPAAGVEAVVQRALRAGYSLRSVLLFVF